MDAIACIAMAGFCIVLIARRDELEIRLLQPVQQMHKEK